MVFTVDLYKFLFNETKEQVQSRAARLPIEEQRELMRMVADAQALYATNKLAFYKPFPKQLKFYEMAKYARVAFMFAGNQQGKTACISAGAGYHATGLYPDWWPGRRYDHPIDAWAAGVNAQATRDVLQSYLLGPHSNKDAWGTGFIPKEYIIGTPSPSPGNVKNAVDTIRVRHVSGGESIIGFKNYEQGREAWQGPPKDFIILDEEAPADVFAEAKARTLNSEGHIESGFTPLKGFSQVVSNVYNEGIDASDLENLSGLRKGQPAFIRMTIDDRIDLTEQQKRDRIDMVEPHEREARLYGIPKAGKGAVFGRVPWGEVMIDPIPIPGHWKVIGGIDFGYGHPTAAVKIVYDPETDVKYVVEEYLKEQEQPIVHWATLKNWGVPIWSWPVDGNQKKDGHAVRDAYQRAGMNMTTEPARLLLADGSTTNSVEAGIQVMLDDMLSGRMFIFKTCYRLEQQLQRLHRDSNSRLADASPKLVKSEDDLFDACRYGVTMLRYAKYVSPDFNPKAGYVTHRTQNTYSNIRNPRLSRKNRHQ